MVLSGSYHFQVPFVKLWGVILQEYPIFAPAGCANCSNTPTLPKHRNRYGSAGHGRSPKTSKCQWRFETTKEKRGQYEWDCFLTLIFNIPADFHCPSSNRVFPSQKMPASCFPTFEALPFFFGHCKNIQMGSSRANDVTTKLIAGSLTFYKGFEGETTVPPKMEQIHHPYLYTQFFRFPQYFGRKTP